MQKKTMSSIINEEINDFEEFEWMKNHSPCFSVDPININVIQAPNEFYETLKNIISKSKKRIILSSLYLGIGQLEKELVDCIDKTMEENNEINTRILLDYSRGLRGEINSKNMVQKLINKYSKRFDLYLYHTPKLRGLLKKLLSERTNETVGVQHMKIYISDNNLIISGANLSNDYFVNRQDRYFLIKNCQDLCDFFESIIDSFSFYSFKVDQNGQILYLNDNLNQHPFNGNYNDFSNGLSDKLNQVLKKYKELQNHSINFSAETEKSQKNIAYIYPLIQIYDCSIRLDEYITKTLFDMAPSLSHLYLAVGYFNLTNDYTDSIIKYSQAKFNILLSSPEANGFFDANGFSNNIPKIYSFLEEEFLNLCSSLKQNNRIVLNEYKKDKWTFHAKGLWYYPKCSNSKLPCLTIIGSSNYGYRSTYRDVEAQLLVFSNNEIFQKNIDLERKRLFENSTIVTNELFTHNSRILPVWLKLFAKAFRSYF